MTLFEVGSGAGPFPVLGIMDEFFSHGILMDIGKLVGDIAQPAANEVEIAWLPERAGMMAVLLDGKTSFEFPLVHDVGDEFRTREQKQMAMVRHEDVAKQENIQGLADTIHAIENEVHFGGSEARDAIRKIGGDEEIAAGVSDAAQAGLNGQRIVLIDNIGKSKDCGAYRQGELRVGKGLTPQRGELHRGVSRPGMRLAGFGEDEVGHEQGQGGDGGVANDGHAGELFGRAEAAAVDVHVE